MGEKVKKGLSMFLFLAINAKGGESISPKQKDCTTNLNFFRNDVLFDFHKILFLQLVSYDKQFLKLVYSQN
jgi:hypothetical protein